MTPASVEEVATCLLGAASTGTAVYPIGGGTSLDFGRLPSQLGMALQTTGLNRIVDYQPRDMTISVEAGFTLQALQQTLAEENQRLPWDVPFANRATIGGILATNHNGPRRYGDGTVRDDVIGIQAVDGQGNVFRGGGNVVKNVAGYDFCKLLTGSLGTLGIVTRVTLKLKPCPAAMALWTGSFATWDDLEQILAALVTSACRPSAVEVLAGPHEILNSAWPSAAPDALGWLLVALEGSEAEVDWMSQRLEQEWHAQPVRSVERIADDHANRVWQHLTESAAPQKTSLSLRINVVPSATIEILALLREIDPQAVLQAHAGNGIVLAHFSEDLAQDLPRLLVQRIHPSARKHRGHAMALSGPLLPELTRQAFFGPPPSTASLMAAVKKQFDPHHILNPGRAIFDLE